MARVRFFSEPLHRSIEGVGRRWGLGLGRSPFPALHHPVSSFFVASIFPVLRPRKCCSMIDRGVGHEARPVICVCAGSRAHLSSLLNGALGRRTHPIGHPGGWPREVVGFFRGAAQCARTERSSVWLARSTAAHQRLFFFLASLRCTKYVSMRCSCLPPQSHINPQPGGQATREPCPCP